MLSTYDPITSEKYNLSSDPNFNPSPLKADSLKFSNDYYDWLKKQKPYKQAQRWENKQNRADRFKGIPFLEWGAAAGQLVDDIFTAAGGGFDYPDQVTSENIGMSKAAQIGNAITKIFPGMDLFSPFFKKMDNFTISDATLKLGGAYTGAMNRMSNAEQVAGMRLPFGRKAAKSAIREAKKLNNTLTDMSLENDKYMSNYAPQILATNNHMIYNGYTPGLTLHKKGGTIPELEEVRTIMQSLQSKKQEIQEPQKFQLGGKMNMIVTGALHARKHNLEELNPDLKGEITKKGIPVVSMNDGGEVQQHSEVEKEELILQIDATKTIEDYYNEYNSTDSKTEKNKIALECGKYLVDELLKNTDDPDKLIKKTV